MRIWIYLLSSQNFRTVSIHTNYTQSLIGIRVLSPYFDFLVIWLDWIVFVSTRSIAQVYQKQKLIIARFWNLYIFHEKKLTPNERGNLS
ncbi:hypothetical protein CMALT430_240005 [Carnobacterium maltaromaticum]|nr:hypothetical protein CMALT430_240005 [Carnobacterium maltaromaticum]